MQFRWNRWNLEHVAKHGVSPDEAASALRGAARRYPRKVGADRWLVWGRGRGGRLLQVVAVLDREDTVFVIHARPLTEREKRRFRRRK